MEPIAPLPKHQRKSSPEDSQCPKRPRIPGMQFQDNCPRRGTQAANIQVEQALARASVAVQLISVCVRTGVGLLCLAVRVMILSMAKAYTAGQSRALMERASRVLRDATVAWGEFQVARARHRALVRQLTALRLVNEEAALHRRVPFGSGTRDLGESRYVWHRLWAERSSRLRDR